MGNRTSRSLDPQKNCADKVFLFARESHTVPVDVTHVTVHSSVKEILPWTFARCDKLTKVELHKGLQRIGERSFYGCNSLKRVDIPASVHTIDKQAFASCTQLSDIELHPGLIQIKEGAFEDCTSLTRLTVPSTVKSVEDGAFRHCIGLLEVDFGSGELDQLGPNVFLNCLSLKHITLPPSLKVIPEYTFMKCKQLEAVELSSELTAIRKHAFRDCKLLKCIEIPPRTTSIGLKAFHGCDNMQSVILSEGLEEIGNQCFADCTSLQYINIPSAVSSIGWRAFAFCKGLKTVKISNSVQSFPFETLHYCKSVEHIEYASWKYAPKEVIQYMITSHYYATPDSFLDWDSMVELLCRHGAPLGAIQTLLESHQVVSECAVNWQKVARELVIYVILQCDSFRGGFRDNWRSMIDALATAQVPLELIAKLSAIQEQTIHDTINYRNLCEELVQPLKGWWRKTHEYGVTYDIFNHFNHELCFSHDNWKTFQFLVKSKVSERLAAVFVNEWREEILCLVAMISKINRHHIHLEVINATLSACEHGCKHLQEATTLLELALWKARLAKDSETEDQPTAESRAQCRIVCGADVIVPNVLSFLKDIPDIKPFMKKSPPSSFDKYVADTSSILRVVGITGLCY